MVPVLLVTFAPITGQRDHSEGSGTSGVGVGVGVAEGVGVGVGVGSTGLKTGFKSGFAAAFTDTPLFHTRIFPDLTQVYFFPPAVAVAPAFMHLVPGLTAAVAMGVIVASKSALTDKSTTFLRIEQL
jgi:hypothetical protein